MLEAGEDLDTIRHWLGHSSIETTSVYLHVSSNRGTRVKSPVEDFVLPALS